MSQVTIKLRRDSAQTWIDNNPILNQGEPGLELDTNKMKVGNGSDAWNDLPYLAGEGGGSMSDDDALDKAYEDGLITPYQIENALITDANGKIIVA